MNVKEIRALLLEAASEVDEAELERLRRNGLETMFAELSEAERKQVIDEIRSKTPLNNEGPLAKRQSSIAVAVS